MSSKDMKLIMENWRKSSVMKESVSPLTEQELEEGILNWAKKLFGVALVAGGLGLGGDAEAGGKLQGFEIDGKEFSFKDAGSAINQLQIDKDNGDPNAEDGMKALEHLGKAMQYEVGLKNLNLDKDNDGFADAEGSWTGNNPLSNWVIDAEAAQTVGDAGQVAAFQALMQVTGQSPAQSGAEAPAPEASVKSVGDWKPGEADDMMKNMSGTLKNR